MRGMKFSAILSAPQIARVLSASDPFSFVLLLLCALMLFQPEDAAREACSSLHRDWSGEPFYNASPPKPARAFIVAFGEMVL